MFGIVGKPSGAVLNASALLLARAQPVAAAARLGRSACAYTPAAIKAMAMHSALPQHWQQQQRMGMHTTPVAAVKKTPGANQSVDTQTMAAAAEVTPKTKAQRIDPSLPGLTLTTWGKIKAYAMFYFTGIKQIRQNGRTVKAVLARIRAGGEGMSREELQIQVRHAQDKIRLVPFVLTILVLEEFSLLALMAVPSLCPSTCVTYGQAMGVAKKHDAVKLRLHAAALERIKGLELEAAAFAKSETLATLGANNTDAKLFAFKDLTRADLQLVNRFMGVTGRIATPISTTNSLRSRLLKHLEYLQQDDRLLVKEELVTQLPLIELHNACQERGIPSAAFNTEDLQKALLSWTALSTNCRSAEELLPIVWSRLVLFNKAVVNA
ncbi:hypothetical protein GGI23_001443 [Coemansia sp. RSA 2559]|nr:hypothetical protein GGI23_001443 [Coemansia sp. RSA 2559]KAJ2866636.1 hypothetical protein GGI22_001238 [Coemansia erecta]